MYDIVTFGSATRDLFIRSRKFKTLKNKVFITGKGLCLGLGSKVQLDDLFFATGGGGTNVAATFAKHAEQTKGGCPVSRALTGPMIVLDAKLK